MTWEELIAKAEEHAKTAGISVDQLHRPKVRETALVSFISKNSTSTAKFHLDASTGELISVEFSGAEFTPKRTGKQLSKRAQRVLELASEESKRMGCEHVGSDHLLLGLLVDGQGIGSAALVSVGLATEVVRSRITSIGCTAEVASNGYTEVEVGAMLHMSQCAVNKRKQAGLKALRESLGSADYFGSDRVQGTRLKRGHGSSL
jgi:ATP-dependent Clp protease ATP-binding subunit ClpA